MKHTSRLLAGLLMGLMSLPVSALQAVDDAIIELFQRVDELQKEVASLRGQNERLSHEIGQLRRNQKENFVEIDEQLQRLAEQNKKPSDFSEPPIAPPVIEDTKPDTPSGAVISPSRTSSDAYKNAYALLKDEPVAAIKAFEKFIQDYPTSSLVVNAHYWIGEAYYSMNSYEEATKRFIKILKDYKGSTKESDAALKLGYCFYGLRDWDSARKTFEDVVHFFPNTHEAELAKSKLATLDKAGR